MKKTSIKRIFTLFLVLVMCLGLLPFRPMTTTVQAADAASVVTDLATTAAKSCVSTAAGKVGNIVVSNILSAFGYVDPEAKFRTEVLQSLDDIKSAITEGVKQLSGQLDQIQSDLTTLQVYCAKMKSELFAKIEHAEIDTRLSTLNDCFATVDTIYKDYYLQLAKIDDYDVAQLKVKETVAQIERANLPILITRMRNEYTGTSGGAQIPLITVYATYLMEAYPFMHQVYERLMNFAQYCEYELLRAEQLYLEYCNYQQAANDGSDANVKLWQGNAATALQNLNDGLSEIEALLPDTDYSLEQIEPMCWVNGELVREHVKYHLFSQKYNIDLVFDPGHDTSSFDAQKELLLTPSDLPGVDEYKRLGQLFKDYGSGDKRLLDCINELVGTSISTPMWECACGLRDGWGIPGPAVVNLDDYGQATSWVWEESTWMWVRHVNTPAWHPGQSNALGSANNSLLISTTPASCTEPGEVTYSCVGGGTYSEIILPAGHADEDDDGHCDACNTQMTGEGHCSICGKTEHESRRDEVLHAVFAFLKVLFSDALIPLLAMLKA